MARITRYSFSCPNCKVELSSGWGEGSYAHIPDQFNCARCGHLIVLSESQRRQKQNDVIESRAFQKASKGCLIIYPLASLLGFYLAYLWASNNYRTFDAQIWLVVIGASLLIGLVLSGIITLIRMFIADRQIRKQKHPQKN